MMRALTKWGEDAGLYTFVGGVLYMLAWIMGRVYGG